MISSGSNVGCSAKARGRKGVGGRQRRSAAHAWSGEKLNSALAHADHVSSASLASWLYLGPGHWARGDRKQEGAAIIVARRACCCDDKCASAAPPFGPKASKVTLLLVESHSHPLPITLPTGPLF